MGLFGVDDKETRGAGDSDIGELGIFVLLIEEVSTVSAGSVVYSRGSAMEHLGR